MDEVLQLDALIEPRPAPTMGNLARIRYSHLDMIDCLISNPAMSQNELAARYGYTPAWISNIMASDAWKSMFAARRAEIVDPVITQTVEERTEAMIIRSHERIMAQLDKPDCPANVALKAFELGARAKGMGNQPPAPPPTVDLSKLAERLIELNPKGNVYEGQVISTTSESAPAASGE